MSDKVKMVVVAVILIAAGAVYLSFHSPFEKSPGAGKRMNVDCPACGYHGEIMLDQAIRQGASFSGETGWSLGCPKCGKPAAVRTPMLPATRGEPASASETGDR